MAIAPLTLSELRYLSPLRYPGGKARLANFLKLVLIENRLCGAEYVEPYAGGASVAISLLICGYVSHIHINDLDRSIFALWHSVLHESEALCRLISNGRVTYSEWKRQHEIHAAPLEHSLLELGFSTFFLNRTNRSGIIASAGIIGGTKQTGSWKIGARYNKKELIRRIELIANHRSQISLSNQDAAIFVRQMHMRERNFFFYLDPPYYIKGRRRLYSNFYEHADHLEVSQLMTAIKSPWIISYDNTAEVRALYQDYRHKTYRLSYTARERYSGAEVMFFSNDIIIPSASDPSRISSELVPLLSV